jgi:hypothetical protein
MSATLNAIAASFGVSEPIFVVEPKNNDHEVVFKAKNPYKPDLKDYPSLLGQLVAARYQERFRSNQGIFVNETRCEDVYRIMLISIRKIHSKYGGLKNPKQSKLYKWLRLMEDKYNHPFNEGFISLYLYLRQHAPTDEYRFVDGANNPHVKNILLIIERMKDKYEQR